MVYQWSILLPSACYTGRKLDPLTKFTPLTINLSGHYDILYKQEDIPVPMSISAPTGSNEIMVALNHAQTEHYHPNLPFAVNDFEIPGMALFPSSAMSSPMEMRQYSQYDYSQASLLPISSMSAPARSY